MKKLKKDTENIQKAVKKAQNFEITLADVRRKSEKRAWTVATLSLSVSLLLICGLLYVLPLKEKEPYLVMADVYTGRTTVARLRGDWSDNSITKNEAVNLSNVSHFVVARESFDSQLIYLKDWVTVYAMSTPEVSNAYRALMHHDNPGSPFHVLGKQKSLRVKILSIVLTKNKESGVPEGATVRFERHLLNKNTGTDQHLDNKIATLAFTYNSNLNMEEKHRIENPLGFRVTAYRVDADGSTAPPPPQSPVSDMPQGASLPVLPE